MGWSMGQVGGNEDRATWLDSSIIRKKIQDLGMGWLEGKEGVKDE